MKRVIAVVTATLLVTGVAWSKKPKPEPVAEPVAAPAPAPAAGASDPAALVKYRHSLMEATAKHMGMSKAILDGKVARVEDLAAHADALHAVSRDMGGLFPAGTGPDSLQTEALATIWERPEDFAAAAAAYETSTRKFAEVARTGDLTASADAFGEVGQSCGGCHETFRHKDEH